MSFYNPIIIINEEAHNVIYFPLNRSRPHNINELVNDPSIAWTVAEERPLMQLILSQGQLINDMLQKLFFRICPG